MIPGIDRDSRPWWDALARHELLHQRCDACGRWRWPPRAICGDCGSFDWSWQPVSGRGVVASHIRTHHSFLPDVAAPYTTVFVALAEQDDIVLPSWWRGEAEPVVGEEVEAVFIDHEYGTTLLGWIPVNERRGSTT